MLVVGNCIIALQAQQLLTGCHAFSNQGLLMIIHPHFEGVTMYQPEDKHIMYTGKPVVTGYCKKIENKFWQIPIKAPQYKMPKKLSLVNQLLLSILPPVSCEQVSEAKEILHNVYEIPSLDYGIRWMHAICGYLVKLVWIKAIWIGNFTGWPLLTVENVYKLYPIIDEMPIGNTKRQGNLSVAFNVIY